MAAVTGLLAPWIGGASKPQSTVGYRGLLAFWMGGASPGESVVPPVVVDQPSGGFDYGYVQSPQARAAKILKDRIELGIVKVPPEEIVEIAVPLKIELAKFKKQVAQYDREIKLETATKALNELLEARYLAKAQERFIQQALEELDVAFIAIVMASL